MCTAKLDRVKQMVNRPRFDLKVNSWSVRSVKKTKVYRRASIVTSLMISTFYALGSASGLKCRCVTSMAIVLSIRITI